MYHMSANLAFGRREKNIWGYKKLQGSKKPIRKTEKKVATFFFVFFLFFFFGDSKKFVGAAKNEQGAPNGNVTPLVEGYIFCERKRQGAVLRGKVAVGFSKVLKNRSRRC